MLARKANVLSACGVMIKRIVFLSPILPRSMSSEPVSLATCGVINDCRRTTQEMMMDFNVLPAACLKAL